MIKLANTEIRLSIFLRGNDLEICASKQDTIATNGYELIRFVLTIFSS
jgi:hypothetical protein